MQTILKKLSEPSTWAGLGLSSLAVGWFDLGAEFWDQVFVLIPALFGLAAIFLKERGDA